MVREDPSEVRVKLKKGTVAGCLAGVEPFNCRHVDFESKEKRGDGDTTRFVVGLKDGDMDWTDCERSGYE